MPRLDRDLVEATQLGRELARSLGRSHQDDDRRALPRIAPEREHVTEDLLGLGRVERILDVDRRPLEVVLQHHIDNPGGVESRRVHTTASPTRSGHTSADHLGGLLQHGSTLSPMGLRPLTPGVGELVMPYGAGVLGRGYDHPDVSYAIVSSHRSSSPISLVGVSRGFIARCDILSHMPELPEVETTVRGLRERVLGKTITDFWCNAPGMIRYISPVVLKKLVVGKKIIATRRRAKHILIDLSGSKTLVVHMKMTGHLLYGKYTETAGTNVNTWEPTLKGGPLRDPYNRFIRVVFSLSNGQHLAFCDMRKFGKIAIHDTNNLHSAKELADLGPELWELKAPEFVKIMGAKKAGKVKQVLLDQKVLAGVGNIYSDEGLWAAGVDPRSKPNKIPETKLLALFKALVAITKRSLKTGGDSMSDYRNVEGLGGKFQNFHKAYKQTGKACKRPGCRGNIVRIVVASRSTHFCPKHQTLYAD